MVSDGVMNRRGAEGAKKEEKEERELAGYVADV